MFAMIESWNSRTANSRMEEFLQILGVGNVTELTGFLVVQNIGVNSDANLNLKFLGKLQRVDIFYVGGTTPLKLRWRRNSKCHCGTARFQEYYTNKKLLLTGDVTV